MLPWITALVALALVALAAACGWLFLRARDGRRQLAQELHDRGLALDRRCDDIVGELRRVGTLLDRRCDELDARLVGLAARADALHRRLDGLAEERRVDRLLDLVAEGVERGALPEAGAARLRRAVRELRDGSAAPGPGAPA
jgi:hypothetical protein